MRPSAEAANKLYSVLPNNGDGDFQFNRDSSATLINSKGLIQTVGYFGNELITNGNFATDSDWNKNSNWTISGGTANCDGTSNSDINQGTSLFTPVLGKTYKVSIEITSISQGGIRVSVGGSGTSYYTSTGIYTSYLTTISTDRVRMQPQNSAIGSIDNVSVKEVLGDRPRFNYEITNGLVGGCPSLLLETASTNLFPYSQDFSNSAWTKTGSATVTTNTTISPDGTQNADTLSLLVGSYFYESISSGAGTFTISCYVRVTSGTLDFKMQSFTPSVGANASSVFTANTEWQRFEFTTTVTADSNFYPVFIDSPLTGGVFEIWGAQLEQQSYATSYIPTNGASQTRAAETCNGAGTASTFNSTEGVLYAELKALSADGTNRYISLNDGTTSNRVNLFYDTNNVLRGFITGISSMATSATITDTNKVAIKYKSGDIALWLNGVEVATKTDTISLSGLSSLSFDQTGGLNWYGNVKDLRVYNEALTDAQLQTLTTL
jgi:hypothetical protein